jgi:hypothetical protein
LILDHLVGGEGEHLLYWDGSLKEFVVPMVIAEMLSCKLLSTVAAGSKHLYITCCDENHLSQAMPELCVAESSQMPLPENKWNFCSICFLLSSKLQIQY